MKNIGILLLVVLCIVSCKKYEDPVTSNTEVITEINYRIQIPIDIGFAILGEQELLVIDENMKQLSVSGFDFSGNPAIVNCSQDMMGWDNLI